MTFSNSRFCWHNGPPQAAAKNQCNHYDASGFWRKSEARRVREREREKVIFTVLWDYIRGKSSKTSVDMKPMFLAGICCFRQCANESAVLKKSLIYNYYFYTATSEHNVVIEPEFCMQYILDYLHEYRKHHIANNTKHIHISKPET